MNTECELLEKLKKAIPMTKMVRKQEHYVFNQPAYEIADITITLPHPIASAIEYLYRSCKNPATNKIDDLHKARWWIDRYIKECNDDIDLDIIE